jgi:NTE family protein
MRLSVGAVNVRTGQFSYFDSAKMPIRPEHIMASSALPPGFPPIEIDGEYYWDGGLFSNTPLEYVLDYSPRRSRLTFQVDLFHAQGRLPTNLDEVSERDKDIRYSSRTNVCSNAFRDRHNVRHAINELHKLLPPELASTEQAKRLYEYGCVTEMDIVRLIYRPVEPQGASKIYDFSRSSMEKRGNRGDLTRVLCCTRRHGLRRHQRSWACVCSMCREKISIEETTICRCVSKATWVLICNS